MKRFADQIVFCLVLALFALGQWIGDEHQQATEECAK